MKKFLLYSFFVLMAMAVNAQKGPNIYYYYKGKKVYYPTSTDRLIVGTDVNQSFAKAKISFSKSIGIAQDSLVEVVSGKQFLIKLSRNNRSSEASTITRLLQQPGILFARPVFISPSGKYNSYGTDFIVKLKAATHFNQLQKLMDKYDCRLVRKYPFQDDIFILSAGKKAGYDGLALANVFYETGLFDYAEPDKIVYGALNVAPPNDPLYSTQWAHNNIGAGQNGNINGVAGADMDVLKAWDITMGSPAIKVGVIDEGVDLTHPDLQGNLLQGFNGTTMTSNPGDGAPVYASGAHGTNCAGIIAALANNNLGVAGVAPNCKIIPANIFSGANGAYSGDAAVAASFDYVRLSGADVISNSWGGGSVSSIIDASIDRAVTLGRGGKGCVVFFSSGNDNASTVVYPASNSQVISVGGVNMCGIKKSPTTSACDGEGYWGSNYGSGLDVVAPCIRIATTDLQGAAGYNTSAGIAGDYNPTFNGTSSACPNAAAVMALILSVNPTFTVAQATAILEQSCTKLPGYVYTDSTPGQPNGSWNNATGHGRVNAFVSVQLAQGSSFCNVSIAATSLDICKPVVLSVSNVLPAATYQWFKDGVPVSSGTTYTTSQAGSYHAVCSRGGCTSISNVINLASIVKINAVTASPAAVCTGGSIVLNVDVNAPGSPAYCTPVYIKGTGDGDFISKINIVGTALNNTSAGAAAFPYYTLYPASGNTTAALAANTTYTISVSGGDYSDAYIRAWIDYNQDGIFTAAETIGISGNVGGFANGTITFTIPANAGNGLTRLRFRSNYTTDDLGLGAACVGSSTQYGETEDYDITITGGIDIPNVSYLWNESGGSTTLAANNTKQVSAANIVQNTSYTVKVTFNAGTCSSTATVPVTVSKFAAISSISATANPICKTGTTSLTANGVEGANAVVQWYAGAGGTGSILATGNILNNVSPGTYYARVTADCGSPAELAYTVYAFPGESDTTVSICKSFTWHGITYSKSGDKTYTTTTTAGCDSIITLHLTILQRIPNTFSKTDANCNGSATGSCTIVATGGVAPFNYRIGTTGSINATSGNFNNLKAGTYRAYVQDATGCIGVTAPIVIGQQAPLTAIVSKTNPLCYGGSNGSIAVTPTNGTSPYQYRLGVTGSYVTTNSFGVRAGTYRLFVQDGAGCTNSFLGTVTQPQAVSATFSKKDETCPLSKDGSITVVGSGGTPPYQYSIGTSGAYTTNNNFTGLKAGTYRVFVKDANGCSGGSIAAVLVVTSDPCAPPTPFARSISGLENGKGLHVSLSPNPTNNLFSLTTHTSSPQTLRLRVMDAVGKTVYQASGQSWQTFRFGEQFPNGLYLIEVRQGEYVKIIKAVKSR